jgi:hypothetical protein
MTEDGREVAFWSSATNLVAADTNTVNDVFSRARCVDASWTNYGSGFPGKNGVPTLTAESNPDLGTTLTLDLSNSSASFTAALVFVGFQQTQFHSGLGGDVLVVPALSILVGLPPSGTSLTGALPSNEAYCGLEIDLQAIEADAGAAKGVSFTQGIELVLGE